MKLLKKIFVAFLPPPAIPKLADSLVAEEYLRYKKRIFIGIFIGYGAAYLIRKNFSLAMPYLVEQGYTKFQLGLVLTSLAVAYGISKFVMGVFSDRASAKYFLATGLSISVMITLVFGFSSRLYHHFNLMVYLMFLHGWAQGMCHPPCARLLAHWYSARERGRVMVVNISQNLAAGLTGILAVLGRWWFGDWQSLFYLPAILAAISIFLVFRLLEDTPQSVGLPPVEKAQGKADTVFERELSVKEIFFKHVFNNKAVWLLSFANVFVYFVRCGVLDWAPTYLAEVKGLNYQEQGVVYFLCEYAGVVSIILCAYLNNKLFGDKRVLAIIFFMILVFFFIALYWLNPVGNYLIDKIALVGIGFSIYAPLVLIGIQTIDLVYKKAVGTATGLTGLFGYLGGTVSGGAIMGWLVENHGWNAGFIALLSSTVLTMLIMLPILLTKEKKCQNSIV